MANINRAWYTITIRNRFTRTAYSIERTTDLNRVYRVQDEYLGKFWIKVEVNRWD